MDGNSSIRDSLKQTIVKIFPRLYGEHILRSVYHFPQIQKEREKRILRIRSTHKANVLFIASSMSMWRLESVYRLLKEDERFQVLIVICPFRTFVAEQKKKSVDELVAFAHNNGWLYSVKDNLNDSGDVIASFQPDIIFYPQLYGRLFENELDCEKNLDRLIAYVPYGLPTVKGEWMYNSRYMNLAWKLFFPTRLHLMHARKNSFNRARNMEIVGDPHASAFYSGTHSYAWKEQDNEKRKLIWAPHFSIGDGGYLHRASFLWLHDIMWDIAQAYKDSIQFVFKPHPRLLSELYRHPDWGKDRADAYYEKWAAGDNTQLETGEYIDLFCTSDAMIHDCGSFSAEYHYTGKPVLFASQDFKSIYEGLDDFGTRCLDLHYQACDPEGIHAFIRDVVLQGNDPMKTKRDAFRNEFMIPKEGESFEQNVYRSLTKDLFKE